MTSSQFLQEVRTRRQDGCVVDRCEDQGCELALDGLDPDRLATIGGTNYQAEHRFNGGLCDFIVFGDDGQRFICAAELKGGANLDAREALDQIKNGLCLAEEHAGDHPVESWFPLLLHDQVNPRSRQVRFLNSNQVEFRGERRRIRVVPCVSHLRPIVRPG